MNEFHKHVIDALYQLKTSMDVLVEILRQDNKQRNLLMQLPFYERIQDKLEQVDKHVVYLYDMYQHFKSFEHDQEE